MNQLFTFLKALKKLRAAAALPFLFFLQTAQAQNVLVGLSSNGGPEGRGTAFSINTSGTNFSVIKGFEDWGGLPNGSLLKDNDGNFYGMTSKGGTYNIGSIFSMTPAGKITILKQFNLNTDGGYPDGELIKGADGYFYGMTLAGGLNSYGTIFKISAAGDFSVIRSFNIGNDGGNPHGHLTLAKDGNFYGITHGGGSTGAGTIFKLTPGGIYSVIHQMNKATEGGDSYGSLTEGKDGNLYGATYDGGSFNYGTIFKITTGGVLTVLKHLSSATDGGYPQCDLIQATDNNFYGTCYNGGSFGYGTIFKITGAGVYSVVKNFSYAADGGTPYGGLMQNTDGNFYGITRAGGSKTAGTIYKLTQAGVYSVIHTLDPVTEGNTSSSVLVNGSDNNLYAMCSLGGSDNLGTAFKVSTSGTFTMLTNFNGASKYGNAPYSTFIKGADSAYYATTSSGGTYGYGSIVKICGGITSVLYSFNKTADGGYPKGKLLLANDGNFYGMTSDGGSKNAGTIFKITPNGNYTVLHVFNSPTEGGYPFGGLIQATDGYLYGITSTGGANTSGTIFKISLAGSFTVIKSFVYATDGNGATGDLVQANDGNFYGMTSTSAKIFKLTPAGTFTVMHSFISSTEGYIPLGSLIQGIDGNLYGTCSDGGANSAGTVFQVSLSGTFKTIHSFDYNTQGKMPKGSLVQGTDGMMYGTTSIGGTYNAGTIFKISPGGATFSVLRNMNMASDGGNAYGSLIFAPVNNLVANTQNIATNEDIKKKITLTGSGGAPLEYNVASNPLHGKLSGTGAKLTYTPNKNYSGNDQFSFTVSVGCLTSAPAIVKITVNAVADTPVLAPIGNKTVVKNATLTFTASATDADRGQQLTYSLIGAPAGAGIDAITGVFTWKPTASGSFSFKVRVTDNSTLALYDEEQITVTVTNTFTAGKESGMAVNNGITASIYPNPVANELHVAMQEQADEVQIKIVDMKGSIISSKIYHASAKNNFTVDASQLKSGVYILQLQAGNITGSYKFIKE